MATRSLGVLTLDLVMKLGGFRQGADQATREFDKFSKKIQSSASSLSSNLRNLGGAILGGLSVAAIIQSTAEAEKALAKLDQAVKNNGGAAGRTTEQLAAFSSELQSISVFGDEAIQTAQSLLLRFNSISGVNFDRATESVLDLASALDKDLSTVALQLGRALEDPTRGLTKLARTGVIFSQAQEDIVKSFVDAGEKAKAQTFILDELEKKFGNAAEAARDNFGGALTGLKNAFGDLLEAKGGLPETVSRLEELTEVLSSEETKRSTDVFASGFINALGAIAAAVGPVLVAFAKLINAAGDLGARIDRALFGRTFDDELEKRLFGVNAQLAELKARRDELERTGGLSEILGIKQAAIGQVDRQIADLEAQRPRGPSSRYRRRQQSDITVISDEDAAEAEKLFESTRTAAEKYREEIARLDELLAKSAITQDVYNRAVAKAKEDLNKGSKGSKSTANEVEAARKKIEDTITALETQAATFGLGEQAALRYSVSQGELARSLDRLGASAGPLKEKLVGLIDEAEVRNATAAIDEQLEALYEEIATLGLSEEEALQYSIAQGEIAKQLALTGEQADVLRAKLEAANAGLAEARRQLELETEAKSIFEATRTDAEKYAAELEKLGEMLENEALTQDTYNRAVADAVIQYKDGETAAKAYAARIQELNDLLAEGTIGQEAYQAAVAKAQEVFAEAGREAAKVFVDEAKRNTQDILADFLTDPFSRGIDGLIEDFDDMFKKIAAQAVAARIADKLFSGFDAWIDKAIAGMSSVFSASGSGGGSWLSSLGSFATSLFGGSSMSGLSEIEITATRIPGYAAGGFTGSGGKHTPAGVVHANEYVMPMERVTEPGALPFLEAFHREGMSLLRGYADGGLVTSPGSLAIRRVSEAVRPTETQTAPMTVSQQFMISAPNGSVSRQTQQQIAAAAARGLAQANRRNN